MHDVTPEAIAARLVMLGAGATYARALAEAGGDALVADALDRAVTFYGRETVVRRHLDDVERAVRTAAQRAGLPLQRTYTGRGPYNGNQFDGEIAPDYLVGQLADRAVRTVDAERRAEKAEAACADLAARVNELLDALRLARENRRAA